MKANRLFLGAVLATMVVPPPVEVARDSTGQLKLSVVTGRAQLESKHFDCEGNLVSADRVKLRSTGARLDYFPADIPARMTGFAGKLTTKTSDVMAQDYTGAFGGAQVAREGRRTGIGIGVTHVSGRDAFTLPSAYLRFGELDHTHFQADFLPPEEALGMSGFARIGVGFHQGDVRRFGGLIGVGLGPYSYENKIEPRLLGDFSLPIDRRWDLLFGAQVGTGQERTQWAGTIGLRVAP